MDKKRISGYILLSFSLLFLQSCIDQKDEYVEPPKPAPETFFDFGMTSTYPTSLNYGLKDYRILFEVFMNDPFTTDVQGDKVRTDEEPLYRGITDQQGAFTGELSLPAGLKSVYLYSDFIGMGDPIEVQIKDGNILLDRNALKGQVKQQTRATNGDGTNTYPDGWLTLGNWTQQGIPSYLEAERAVVESGLLYDVRKVFLATNGNKPMGQAYPEFIGDDVYTSINIKKETSVQLALLQSTASKRNAICYYTYPTGQRPKDQSQIKNAIIAYPHVSNSVCNSINAGSMELGDKILLKYWDGTKFTNKFPAGVSLGWFLVDGGWQGAGKVSKGINLYHSIRELNANNQPRVVALKDRKEGKLVVIGFEDAVLKNIGDGNFGDAVFYFEFDKAEDIETSGVGTLPDSGFNESDYATSYWGTLSFEDMWPKAGDYDMNDVVIKFHRTIYKEVLSNKVNKVVDVFTPLHNGARLVNGFGYQLVGVSKSTIKNVSIQSKKGTSSSYMKGEAMEPGIYHPTMMLFDDFNLALNKQEEFTVTVDFVAPTLQESMLIPFYTGANRQYYHNFNPFIVIEANKARGHEAHLAKFEPTELADLSFFGTADDASRPDEKLYYVTKNNSPTGIFTPFHLFRWPKEGISVKTAYSQFSKWAESLGTDYATSQWYKHPVETAW